MQDTQNSPNNQEVTSKINKFFSTYHISRLAYRSGAKKEAGIPVITVLLSIFVLPFMNKNLYSYFKEQNTEFQKDTAYSLLRSPNISWRNLLQKIVINVLKFFYSLTENSEQGVLIVDDSLLERPRAKKVELCSCVYDHALKKFTKGYRFLCLGWSDGNSFAPVDFALISSKKSESVLQESKKRLNSNTCGAKRRKEAKMTAPELTEAMLSRAKKEGIQASHVLMDSWFGTPSVVTSCSQYYPVICMVKKTAKIHYLIDNKELDVKEIYRCTRKRPGKAQWLASVIVTLKTGIKVRLVFIRNRCNPKDWLVIMSTDTELDCKEIIRLYGLRWDIEVFFRTIKQHLSFTKGYQGRDFEGIIAYCTIVCMRYIFLSIEQRQKSDQRTLGLLFQSCCDELQKITMIDALKRILDICKEEMTEIVEVKKTDTETYTAIFETIIAKALQFFGFLSKIDDKYAINAA